MTTYLPQQQTRRRPSRPQRAAVLALGAAMLLGALAPAQLSAAEAAQQAAAAIATAPARRVNVEVLKLAPQGLNVYGSYVGDLQPNERVVLRSEVEGQVERLTFDDADPVKKGQVLANVGTEQATVRRDQAKVNLDLARTNAERTQTLFDKQLVPPQTLDDTRTALEVARLNLQSAELDLQKSIIRSPIEGVVKTRSVSLGEFAQKGALVAEVLDLHVMVAKVQVPEREILYFTPGKRVTVWLDAFPGRTFPGTVKTIGPEADSKSRNFPVEVEVDNKDRILRAGMLARAKADLIAASNQIVIPRSAVLERPENRIVYVEEGGLAKLRVVQLGATAGDQVQVLSGLAAGDRLIVAGHTRIGPEEPVLVIRSGVQPGGAQ